MNPRCDRKGGLHTHSLKLCARVHLTLCQTNVGSTRIQGGWMLCTITIIAVSVYTIYIYKSRALLCIMVMPFVVYIKHYKMIGGNIMMTQKRMGWLVLWQIYGWPYIQRTAKKAKCLTLTLHQFLELSKAVDGMLWCMTFHTHQYFKRRLYHV